MSKTRQPSIGDAINREHALEFSYADYHDPGLDYLCLFRSTGLTLKAYFIDDGSKGDILIPHNHRYSFDSRIIAGSLVETQYVESLTKPCFLVADQVMKYRYDCIADGGAGYDEATEVWLMKTSTSRYTRYAAGVDGAYNNYAHKNIHTLSEIDPGTIILLTQYADEGSRYSYGYGHKFPECVYRKMSPRDVEIRIEQLHEAMKAKL